MNICDTDYQLSLMLSGQLRTVLSVHSVDRRRVVLISHFTPISSFLKPDMEKVNKKTWEI
jgi:hypothetical protein